MIVPLALVNTGSVNKLVFLSRNVGTALDLDFCSFKKPQIELYAQFSKTITIVPVFWFVPAVIVQVTYPMEHEQVI